MMNEDNFSDFIAIEKKPCLADRRDINVLKAIDLFAGIGGIRRGFKNIFKNEIDFVFSSEIDKNAQKIHKTGVGIVVNDVPSIPFE